MHCLLYPAPDIDAGSGRARRQRQDRSKPTFEAMAFPAEDSDYFLRPDRILGAFLLDPTAPGTAPPADALTAELQDERECDLDTKARLHQVELQLAENESSVTSAQLRAEFNSRASYMSFDFGVDIPTTALVPIESSSASSADSLLLPNRRFNSSGSNKATNASRYYLSSDAQKPSSHNQPSVSESNSAEYVLLPSEPS